MDAGSGLALDKHKQEIAQAGLTELREKLQPELAALYGWLRPKLVLPVHGEIRHMHEQARFALERGVPDTLVQENGDLVRLAPGPARIVERVRSGRLIRVVVSARDVPGSLARITALVAEAGANVDEVHHQRAFTLLAAQNVEIEMVLQTRDAEHVRELLARLAAEGLQARWLGEQ